MWRSCSCRDPRVPVRCQPSRYTGCPRRNRTQVRARSPCAIGRGRRAKLAGQILLASRFEPPGPPSGVPLQRASAHISRSGAAVRASLRRRRAAASAASGVGTTHRSAPARKSLQQRPHQPRVGTLVLQFARFGHLHGRQPRDHRLILPARRQAILSVSQLHGRRARPRAETTPFKSFEMRGSEDERRPDPPEYHIHRSTASRAAN